MRKEGLPARGSRLVSGTKGKAQRRSTSRDTASYVRRLFTRAAYLPAYPAQETLAPLLHRRMAR